MLADGAAAALLAPGAVFAVLADGATCPGSEIQICFSSDSFSSHWRPAVGQLARESWLSASAVPTPAHFARACIQPASLHDIIFITRSAPGSSELIGRVRKVERYNVIGTMGGTPPHCLQRFLRCSQHKTLFHDTVQYSLNLVRPSLTN